MERALKTIAKLRLSQDPAARLDLARRAWPLAVGKKIAVHSAAVKLVRSTLLVDVDDFIWQKQLFTLRSQILAKLTDLIGKGVVDDVEFRVGVPRRIPQREERAAHSQPLLGDEAEGIPDAALRRVYKVSRQRALA